jgi:phosphate starvation-inducible membrane PsiE
MARTVLGTIVGIYFKTDRLPVLFLLYVAITALTRFLAVDVKDLSIESMLAVSGSILVLTLAALVVQIAVSRFASPVAQSAIYSDKLPELLDMRLMAMNP